MSEFQAMNKIPRLNREIVITEKIDGTNASVVIVPELIGDGSCTTELDRAVAAEIALPRDAVAHVDGHYVYAGARNNYRLPGKQDNFGFAGFVQRNAEALVAALGPGRHFGEWWGPGINRGYGQAGKTLSLFNVSKWGEVVGYLDPRCASSDDPTVASIHQFDRKGVKRCACRESRAAISLDLDGGRVRSVPVIHEGGWFVEPAGDFVANTIKSWAPDVALDILRREGSIASPGFMRPEGIVVFHTASSALFKATLEDDEKPKGLA